MGVFAVGALGIAQADCGGRNIKEGTACVYTPPTSSTDEMQCKLDTQVALSFEANGNTSAIVELDVLPDANAGQYADATFSYTIGSDNSKWCIDGTGNPSKLAAGCAPCDSTTITNCYPAHDASGNIFPGLIPIGYPMQNADGAKLLKQFGGDQRAAYSQLFDRSFGERVWRIDYQDGGTGQWLVAFVGRRHRTDWKNGESIDYYTWYRLTPDTYLCDGTVTDDGTGQKICSSDNTVVINGATINDDNSNVYDKANDKILLPPMNVLYPTDASGNYSATDDVNGVKLPRPDQSFLNLIWTVPTDPNKGWIYFGKSDGNGGFAPWGILMDENRKPDYSRIAQYGRGVVITKMEIINMLPGYENDTEVIDLSKNPKPLADINSAGALTGQIPARFFELESVSMKMKLYVSDPQGVKPDWQNMFEFVRTTALNIKLVVKQNYPGVCE
jgi:hypothetical protein